MSLMNSEERLMSMAVQRVRNPKKIILTGSTKCKLRMNGYFSAEINLLSYF